MRDDLELDVPGEGGRGREEIVPDVPVIRAIASTVDGESAGTAMSS